MRAPARWRWPGCNWAGRKMADGSPLRPLLRLEDKRPVMISVDDAISALRANAPAPRLTRVSLSRAFGRVLMQPVIAHHDQPPFDAAAMDGYALSAPLIEGETRTVIGESQAGRAFGASVTAFEAVRVFTGAPLPPGTACVVMQEDVVRDGGVIRLRPGAQSGPKPHIRPRGTDFLSGDVLLAPGERLDALKLGLIASSGMAQVSVSRQPRVALICMGDELVAPGQTPRPDQIFESNSPLLKALIQQWGAVVVRSGTQRDNTDDLSAALAAAKADLIVTVGGASVGDYDLVRPALATAGIDWVFEKIDVKPGKPTAFGVLPDGRRVLCLPGNPGSAMTCAHLFLKPLIAAASGDQGGDLIRALPCATGLPANGPREAFLRAVILAGIDGAPVLLPLSDQDSGMVANFAITSALIRRHAHAPEVRTGDVCPCFVLSPF